MSGLLPLKVVIGISIFDSIKELKATGIQVRRSNSTSLKVVKFKKGLFNSHLEIPHIIADDSTKTLLLNLVAYKMSSSGITYQMVTSYICLLHPLIHNVDDVKELQSEGILLNSLGSNEEVANLFKGLTTNLSPDYNAYTDAIKGIYQHYIIEISIVKGCGLVNGLVSSCTLISLAHGL